MTPGREQTNHELHNMKHLVWNIEKAMACTRRTSYEMSRGTTRYTKIILLIDYHNFTMKHTPPFSTTKYTLDILQKHYPELLYQAYIINPPTIFRAFWSCVKSFIDPITKEKIVFCTQRKTPFETLHQNIHTHDKLEIRVGGTNQHLNPFNNLLYQQLPIDVAYDE